jgi:hypothetical protein
MHLTPAQQEEVVDELAAHLEDLSQEQIDGGMSESQALQRILDQESNWRELGRKIERAKEGAMNNRTRQFWVPALVSLTASMTWMMALQIASSKLEMPWKHAGLAVLPYVVWVITLPLIGAATGYWSLRAGSGRPTRMAAVAFPSIVMAVLWLVLLGVVLARKAPQPFLTLNFSYGFLLWVVVPAAALLLGTLPLSRAEKSRFLAR